MLIMLPPLSTAATFNVVHVDDSGRGGHNGGGGGRVCKIPTGDGGGGGQAGGVNRMAGERGDVSGKGLKKAQSPGAAT